MVLHFAETRKMFPWQLCEKWKGLCKLEHLVLCGASCGPRAYATAPAITLKMQDAVFKLINAKMITAGNCHRGVRRCTRAADEPLC